MLQDQRALQDQLVLRDRRDQKGIQEVLALQVHKEYKDPLGLLGRKAIQVALDLKERKVPRVLLGQKVTQGLPGLPVQQDHRDPLEQTVMTILVMLHH